MRKAGGQTTYLNGIMSLPRNCRMLYGHAYQSYVWNKVVSKRLLLSQETIEGDLDLEGNPVPNLQVPLNEVALPLPGSKIE